MGRDFGSELDLRQSSAMAQKSLEGSPASSVADQEDWGVTWDASVEAVS